MADGGKIRVSTEVNTDGIDKGIKAISKKLDDLRKKAEEPYDLNGVKVKGGWNLSEKEQQYYDKLEATLDKLRAKKSEALIGDTRQIQQLQKQTQELQTQNIATQTLTTRSDYRLKRINSMNASLEEMVKNYKSMQNQDIVSEQDEQDAEKLKQDIIDTAQQIEKLNGYKIKIKGISETESDINKLKINFDDIKSSIDKVSKNITGVVKKMAMWGLAIFSIRGAYNLIRNSVSTILQYNDQLNADVQYMKNAIAFTLEPIIVKIVELMKTLMQYVGYIIYAWTGKNIFENANKSLKKANGQANKLKKTLASFDEMNILQDTSSGGGGTTTPSFNLTNPEDVDAPQWIKWIVANKDGILATLGGIASFLGAIKLGFGGIKSIGIGAIFGGAVYTIERLLDYFKKLDPELENNGTNWEDLGKVIKGVSLVLLGLGVVSGNVYVAIAGLILLLASTIMENWDKIREWWNTSVKPKIDGVQTWLEQKLGIFGKVISGTIEEVKRFIVNHFSGILIPLKNVFDGILLFLKGDWKKGIENVVKGVINFIIGRINKLIDGLNTFLTPLRAILVEISNLTGKKTTMSKTRIPNIPYLAKGGIINLPNKGVMVGSAIAGESGREGVLPLTDTQAMQQLGEMIGRYITINANITNTMNGRVISRELQKINNENNFAFNR